MKLKNKIKTTSSTITLYGERFTQLEQLCYDNKISATAFYNTVVGAFATGKLVIENNHISSKRVSGDTVDEVLDNLGFRILDIEGNIIY